MSGKVYEVGRCDPLKDEKLDEQVPEGEENRTHNREGNTEVTAFRDSQYKNPFSKDYCTSEASCRRS